MSTVEELRKKIEDLGYQLYLKDKEFRRAHYIQDLLRTFLDDQCDFPFEEFSFMAELAINDYFCDKKKIELDIALVQLKMDALADGARILDIELRNANKQLDELLKE